MTSTDFVPATPARAVPRRARAEADVHLPGGRQPHRPGRPPAGGLDAAHEPNVVL